MRMNASLCAALTALSLGVTETPVQATEQTSETVVETTAVEASSPQSDLGSVASTLPAEYKHRGLAFSLQAGLLHNEANELVYISGSEDKLSQLNWDSANLPILLGEVRYDLSHYLTIQASGWTALSRGHSYMEDFDWEDMHDRHRRTNASWHPNTSLRRGFGVDVSITPWVLQGENFRVGPVLGYQYTRMKLVSSGGRYDYLSHWNGVEMYEAESGVFADKLLIRYNYTYRMPYLGVAVNYAPGRFEFTGEFRYSAWGKGNDHDSHLLRGLYFSEKFNTVKMAQVVVTGGYYFTPSWKLEATYSYTHFHRARGDTTIRFDGIDESLVESDAAGLRSNMHQVGIGLTYLWH